MSNLYDPEVSCSKAVLMLEVTSVVAVNDCKVLIDMLNRCINRYKQTFGYCACLGIMCQIHLISLDASCISLVYSISPTECRTSICYTVRSLRVYLSHSLASLQIHSGALVSHAFEFDSKVRILFYGAPAVIKFRVPTKAALQQAYLTPILPLDILADKPTEKKFDLALWLAATKFCQAKRLLPQYGSLVSVVSIVTLFIYLLASPSSGNAKGGKEKR